MPDNFFDSIDLSIWGLWIPIFIGVAAGLVALVTGRFVMKLFATMKPPPAPSSDPSSKQSIPQSVEQRAAARRGGNAVAVFVSDPEKTEEPQRGWVVDRSAGGLCVAVENPPELGSTLRIRVCNAPVTVPWAEMEVKSCRKEGNHWEAGCQFLITPSYNVMMLFG